MTLTSAGGLVSIITLGWRRLTDCDELLLWPTSTHQWAIASQWDRYSSDFLAANIESASTCVPGGSLSGISRAHQAPGQIGEISPTKEIHTALLMKSPNMWRRNPVIQGHKRGQWDLFVFLDSDIQILSHGERGRNRKGRGSPNQGIAVRTVSCDSVIPGWMAQDWDTFLNHIHFFCLNKMVKKAGWSPILGITPKKRPPW